jgi:maleate cis-trans isomerase
MKEFQVGLLIPWVNTAMEEEIPALVRPEIGLHWSRLRPGVLPRDGHDSSYLESMLSSLPEALSRFDGLNLQIIVLGCTSAGFMGSHASVEIPESYGGSIFLTAFDALVLQLNRVQAKDVLLFAPYERRVIGAEVSSLVQAGMTVIKAVSIDYRDEIRCITSEQICEIFLQEYCLECDAILFSCTALYTVEAINTLRSTFGIKTPLLSSNTAIASTLNDFVSHTTH